MVFSDLRQRRRHFPQAPLSPIRCRRVIFPGRVPIALDAQLFDRASHIGDAFGIDVELFVVALPVFREMLVARVVRQVDGETCATPRRPVSDPARVDQNHPRIGSKVAQPASAMQPHPAASDNQIVAGQIEFERTRGGLRAQRRIPARLRRLHMDRHDFHAARLGKTGHGL